MHMKKRLLSVLLLLGLLLLLSGCTAHNADVPALEFGSTEGDVSVLRLYFDGDSPVFLENGFTDLCDLYVTGQYRHVFDLEVLETTDTETIYELPVSYDSLDHVAGILIYSDYAYAAVCEDGNLRLHPLSPGAPEKTWEDFYTAAQSYAKTHSELSGVENYGFD